MDIPISLILKFSAKLPAWLQRWYWTEEKLVNSIDLQVRSHGDTLIFDHSRNSKMEVWLRIINLTPFPVMLDRIKIEGWSKDYLGEFWFLERQTLLPGKPKELFVKGFYGVDFSESISANQGGVQCKLIADAYFECKIRAFTKNRHSLGDIVGRQSNLTASAT